MEMIIPDPQMAIVASFDLPTPARMCAEYRWIDERLIEVWLYTSEDIVDGAGIKRIIRTYQFVDVLEMPLEDSSEEQANIVPTQVLIHFNTYFGYLYVKKGNE